MIIAAKEDYICSGVTELHTQCEIAWMKQKIVGCKPLYVCGYYKPSEGDSSSLISLKIGSGKRSYFNCR